MKNNILLFPLKGNNSSSEGWKTAKDNKSCLERRFCHLIRCDEKEQGYQTSWYDYNYTFLSRMIKRKLLLLSFRNQTLKFYRFGKGLFLHLWQ